jgi:hypothetical protein
VTIDTDSPTLTPTDVDRVPVASSDLGQEGEQLVAFLEPDQLVIDKARPVPRAPLTHRANAALWALRVIVLILTAMVIYTFFAQLTS